MKHVAMLYQNAENATAISHIENTIMQIFTGEISIDRYYLDEIDEKQAIVADAYILNGERLLYQIRYHLKDTRNMIILSRSIFKEHLAELLKIPAGTDALVVNDTPVSTAETLYMFYRLGITHLNLVLYDPDLLSSGIYDHIEYAITPSEPQLVPPHVKHIVNTGYREVGFDTLLNLADRLQLDNEQIMGKLMAYFERITEPNMGAHSSYLDSYIKDHIINELIADSFAALLAFSVDGRLIYENDKARALFADEEIPDLSGEDVRNAVITINGSNFLMDRKAIDIGGVHTGYTVSLQDEKSIREVEGLFNKKLKEKGIYARHHFDDIISNTEVMENCISMAKKAARTDYTVLLVGESGTGKELFAQSIHNYSLRNTKPFIAINCAALPDSLLESELFGYEAGAFTGANQKGKLGLFEQANTGTLFLDEIGDISANLQSSLLRVLQEKQIMRVGSNKIIDVDVRIIAATNQDLEKLVKEGTFREDLYYRLSVIPVVVPPLRTRKDDILPMFQHFLGHDYRSLNEKQRALLCSYDWPGNVRELENAAIFYKALGTFPDIILRSQSHSSVNKVMDSPLSTRESIEQDILQLLRTHAHSQQSTGRTEILYMLREKGILISDGKLREFLAAMEEKGLILIGRGRQGTSITEKGLAIFGER